MRIDWVNVEVLILGKVGDEMHIILKNKIRCDKCGDEIESTNDIISYSVNAV